MNQPERISVGDSFVKRQLRVKVVGFKGKTTMMVVVDQGPYRYNPVEYGIRSHTLMRDWKRV